MNLGKDGRKLSYFQSHGWMKKIFKERAWDTMPRGEDDERRARLQLERDSLLIVIGVLSEEIAMLRRAYEKDSQP